jgi:hypothetical protein
MTQRKMSDYGKTLTELMGVRDEIRNLKKTLNITRSDVRDLKPGLFVKMDMLRDRLQQLR